MKFFRFILWLILVIVLVVVGDQLMMKRIFTTPGLTQVQIFYRDFRARLLTLGRPDAFNDRIGQTIEAEIIPPAAGRATRYLYVDRDGVLQFADSFLEVPPLYREKAQPLAE